MPKGVKFDNTQQYYIDMSTEMILEIIEDDMKKSDMFGNTKKIDTSLENGVYYREIRENKGGIEIFTLNNLECGTEYVTKVKLDVDDLSFKTIDSTELYSVRVNKVILEEEYDLCDINALDALNIKITKDIVRQIGKKDRIDTLEILLKTNRLKKSWGNVILECANKIETLEWVNKHLETETDKSEQSIADAYYTAFLDKNIDKIKWLLEHEFEIAYIFVDHLIEFIKHGSIEIFKLLKLYKLLNMINLDLVLSYSLKYKQNELSIWLIVNMDQTNNINEDVSCAVINTFGNVDIDYYQTEDSNDVDCHNVFTEEILNILTSNNIVLNNEAIKIVFYNSCEHNITANILYAFNNFDILNNSEIKKNSILIAIKHNNLNVLDILLDKFKNSNVDIYDAIYNASTTGNVTVLDKLYNFNKEEFIKAMHRTDFDNITQILKIYKNHSELITTHSVEYVDVLKWYKEKGLLSVSLNLLFDDAFYNGNVETLKWLECENNFNYEKHLNQRYYRIYGRSKCFKNKSSNFVESLKWLIEKNFVFSNKFKKEVFDSIYCRSENHDFMLNWIVENIIKSENVIFLASSYTGEFSHEKQRLTFLLQKFPEHEKFINERLNAREFGIDSKKYTKVKNIDEKKSVDEKKRSYCVQS